MAVLQEPPSLVKANQASNDTPRKSFNFWNEQLIPWITLLAIGTYIGNLTELGILQKPRIGLRHLLDRVVLREPHRK